jgi:hypothetical protein
MYFTVPRDYALEMVNLDTWGTTIDVLAGQLNAMLADPNVDPAAALAEAEQEALEKYEEIRGQ